MGRLYLPFVDWMKFLGMFLIVMGHVAARPTNNLLPPIYPKQLGVAFFMFVMAYSLAREKRPRAQVLFNRLFELYLFGGLIAIIMSVVMCLTRGSLQLSNYEPFVLGVNVIFNNFPANPTMWYIGTYFHILVLWALVLRGIHVRPWMLAVSLAAEIPLRAVLITTAGEYIAYMLVPNWITVFMVGLLFGQQTAPSLTGTAERHAVRLLLYGALAVAFGVVWFTITTPYIVDRSFPFMLFSGANALIAALATSVCVSIVYLFWTLVVFQMTRYAQTWGWVRFFARNTLIIFIAHMPVFKAFDGLFNQWGFAYATRAIVQLVICYVGLAIVSELVVRLIRPKELRAWVGNTLLPGVLASVTAPSPAARPQ